MMIVGPSTTSIFFVVISKLPCKLTRWYFKESMSDAIKALGIDLLSNNQYV